MIEERIQEIEETLRRSERIPAATREELVRLLADLKAEVGQLPETSRTHADSIARYAHSSAQEAMRDEKDQAAMDSAITGMTDSVKEFEASHPQLTAVVNRLAAILSNMGI